MRRRKSKMAVLSIWLTGLLVCLTACVTSIGRPGREEESVDDFDIGEVTRVQAYEGGSIVCYEGYDYVREELFADGEQRKENVIRYYDMSWKEITKEQYEALREDCIRDKQETAAYQNWTCFSRDETEGGTLAPELTEKEIISRLFHSFLGSR